jgi:hypothetical protein
LNGPRRPNFYKPEHAEMAPRLLAGGATSNELAGFFAEAPRTVDAWLKGVRNSPGCAHEP